MFTCYSSYFIKSFFKKLGSIKEKKIYKHFHCPVHLHVITVQQGNNLQLVNHFSLSILHIHTFCPHFLIFLPKTHLQCCLVSPKQMPATQRYNYIILVTISICCIKISLSVTNMKTNKQKQYHLKGTLFTTDQMIDVYTTC